MAYAKIRLRRSTKAQWDFTNPILVEGEWGVEVPDTGVGTGDCNVKIGDGVTRWKALPYSIYNTNLVSNVSQLKTDMAAVKAALAALPANSIVYNKESSPPVFGATTFFWISTPES